MKHFFITSSGTDIGKTLVMTALAWQFLQQGKKVTALKPVVTGFDTRDPNSDSALILKSCGLMPTPELLTTISPWYYKAAVSPHLAAAKESKKIILDDVVQFCREHAMLQSDMVLIEGVGGVMVPLNEQHTTLDWMEALGWPVIIVVGSYLGALSHALTAIEVVISRGLALQAVVVSESQGNATTLAETAATLEAFVSPDVPVVKIPRMPGRDELWKTAPPINWMCNT